VKDKVSNPQDSQKYTWDPTRVEQLWRGTIAGGAGLAALSILIDQIRSRRRAAAAEQGQVLEGGQATINLAAPKPVTKSASPIDWAIGAGVGAGAYYLIQKAYKELRKKQLIEEMEAADEAHTQALQESNKYAYTKEASGGVTELMLNSLRNTFWLPAVLAAGGTYGLLENTWPRTKEKSDKPTPKKIVIKGFGTVHADGAGDGPLAELDKQKGKQLVKEMMGEENIQTVARPQANAALDKAALVLPVGLEDSQNAAAFLGYVLSEDPRMHKRSGLLDLVASHYENPEQVQSIVKEASVFEAAELSKGAKNRYELWSKEEKRAAWHGAMKSAILRPGLALWTLAELEELNPDIRKRAQAVVEDPWADLVGTKIASLYWSASNAYSDDENPSEKVAALREDSRKQMETLDLLDSDDSSGDLVDEADKIYAGKKDPIDNFLLGRTDNAKVEA
jgi:hypothetical protein